MEYFYRLKQLNGFTIETVGRLFLSYANTVRLFGAVNLDYYDTVFRGRISADGQRDACEKIFKIFNSDDRPEGYHGRSMSVSDVVDLRPDDEGPPILSTWSCDSIGFRLLT